MEAAFDCGALRVPFADAFFDFGFDYSSRGNARNGRTRLSFRSCLFHPEVFPWKVLFCTWLAIHLLSFLAPKALKWD
jgi:hypothetical protein